jgi:hypothetical protein
MASALRLAAKGFKVFPLEADGSTPAFAGWQAKATSDPALIANLWRSASGEPVPYNIGVLTGDGLTVLDVDTKKGRGGGGSLEILLMLGLNDETFTVRTKSGGKHLYFDSGSLPLRNSVGHLAPGLDVRSEGGYVVGPGSTVGLQSYAIEADLPVAPIDEWFAKRCGEARAQGETVQPLVELDTPDAIARATDWLRNEAPHVTADSGNGDVTAYKVACHVKDFGLSEHECLALILEVFDETKAHPPQGHEVWERKVENAYRHGLSAPGVKNPMADFEVEELAEPASAPRSLARPDGKLLAFDVGESLAFRTAVKRPYLIKGWLSAGTMSMLYGPTNVGKTFVMLDMAFHVALGVPWNGRRVTKSPVIYVAAEGTYDIHDRVAAWMQERGQRAEDCWLTLVPSPVDLRSNTVDLKRLVALVREKIAQWQSPTPPLVVIDTYARAMSGGDENSAADAGLVVKHLDAVRFETGAHVAIVHHSGKDASRNSRGSSALPAAIDIEFMINGEMIHNPKQRGAAKAEDVPYTLKPVGLGVDDEGDPITSCVVLYGAAAEMAEPKLTKQQAQWAADLRQGVAEMAQAAGVLPTEYVFKWQNIKAFFGDMPDMQKNTAVKRLNTLATKGVVLNRQGNQYLIT